MPVPSHSRSSIVQYTPGYLSPYTMKPDVERELKRIADSLNPVIMKVFGVTSGGDEYLTADDLKGVTWDDIAP